MDESGSLSFNPWEGYSFALIHGLTLSYSDENKWNKEKCPFYTYSTAALSPDVWRLLSWIALWVRFVGSGIQRLDMKSLRFMGPDYTVQQLLAQNQVP
jgi:hypothetical protein